MASDRHDLDRIQVGASEESLSIPPVVVKTAIGRYKEVSDALAGLK